MGVIKPAPGSPVESSAIVLDLGDLREEAERLEARARETAASILDEARAERARILEGAHAEGFAEGREAGLAEGRAAGEAAGRAEALGAASAEIEATLAGWDAALREFEARREALLLEAREGVVRLAAVVAERVTKRAVELDPGAAPEQLEAALAMVTAPSRLRVHIAPADRPAVEGAMPDLAARFEGAAHAELVDDESLERGSCVLRTELGVIDARIERQVERICAALLPPASGEAPGDEGAFNAGEDGA